MDPVMDLPETPGQTMKLRVKLCSFAALGPGKADLLEAVDRCGSITAAAKGRGMSCRRAWMLIDEMNHAFREPVVGAVSGGKAGGGTRLTDMGREVQQLAEAVVAERYKLHGYIRSVTTLGRTACGLGD